MTPIRVGIVDDHRMFTDALRMLLGTADDVELVYAVGDGASALKETAKRHPGVIVVDVDLPDVNGVALIPHLLARSRGANVVVVTALSDRDLVRRAKVAGAAGFISKHRAGDDLLEMIRSVAAGRFICGGFDDAAPSEWDIGAVALGRDRDVDLSRREVDVLQGLTDGLSTDELAAALFVSPRTVQGHVQNILAKLSARSKLEAVLRGLRLGMVKLRPPSGTGVGGLKRRP
jgi:DNA-binding NarL/FixJ family response regulator